MGLGNCRRTDLARTDVPVGCGLLKTEGCLGLCTACELPVLGFLWVRGTLAWQCVEGVTFCDLCSQERGVGFLRLFEGLR